MLDFTWTGFVLLYSLIIWCIDINICQYWSQVFINFLFCGVNKALDTFLHSNLLNAISLIYCKMYFFCTAKNTVILPNFLVWKFCKRAQFSHRFERFSWNYVETEPFQKNFKPGNFVKLRYSHSVAYPHLDSSRNLWKVLVIFLLFFLQEQPCIFTKNIEGT